MNWTLLVALASLMSAGGSIVDKYLTRGGAPPWACTASFGIVSLPVAAVGLLLVPPLPRAESLPAWLSGFLYVGAVWFYYHVVAHEPISMVVPLMRLTAVETLLGGALFLHEQLGPVQLAAFVVLFAGSILLSLSRSASGKIRPGVVIMRIVPVTTLLAASNIFLAHTYQSATLWQGQVYQAAGMASSLPLLALLRIRRDLHQKNENSLSVRTWGILLLEQSLRSLTQLAPAIALTQRIPVALVSAATGFQPLWVWILAMVLLEERQSRQITTIRAIGLGGTLLGAFLLR